MTYSKAQKFGLQNSPGKFMSEALVHGHINKVVGQREESEELLARR